MTYLSDTNHTDTLPNKVSNISEPDLKRLKELYTFQGEKDIITFVNLYPFVIKLLFEAEGKIHSYFPEAGLLLRMFNNPEATDDNYLLVQIKTKFSPKETLQRFGQFEDEWWLDAIVQTKGKLSINVKYS